MSNCKIMALTPLIILSFGLTGIGNAVAGTKFKGRLAFYMTKWQQIEVGDVEGHVIATFEKKGIDFN